MGHQPLLAYSNGQSTGVSVAYPEGTAFSIGFMGRRTPAPKPARGSYTGNRFGGIQALFGLSGLGCSLILALLSGTPLALHQDRPVAR